MTFKNILLLSNLSNFDLVKEIFGGNGLLKWFLLYRPLHIRRIKTS